MPRGSQAVIAVNAALPQSLDLTLPWLYWTLASPAATFAAMVLMAESWPAVHSHGIT